MKTYFSGAVALAAAFLLLLSTSALPAPAQTLPFDQAVACGSGEGYYGWGPTKLVVDAQGNRYVAGTFNGTITLGSTILSATQASPGLLFASDNFIAKLDAAGNYLWAVQLSDGQDASITGLAVDATGDVYVTGSFASYSVRFGTGGLVLYNSSAKNEGFVARLNGTTRQWAWARRVGGTGDDGLSRPVLNATGDLYVVGSSGSATADVGPFVLTGPQSFISRLSPAGEWRWVRRVGTGQAGVNTILLDPQGDLYLAGAFSGAVTFGATSLTTQGVPGSPYAAAGLDLFVARITDEGNWVWAVQGDAVTHQNLVSISAAAFDGAGHLYVTGSYTNSSVRIGATVLPNQSAMYPIPIPIPPTPYTNNYQSDVFVARLDASTGAWGWAVRTGGTGNESAIGLVVDKQGRVYLQGILSADPAIWAATDLAQLDGATGNWRSSQPLAPLASHALALDKQDQLHLAGYFDSATAQFGLTTLAQAGAGRSTGFIARAGAGPLAAALPTLLVAGLQVWPNPSGRGPVWVQGVAPGQLVQVLDVLGRVVASGRMPASGPLTLSAVASLAPSVYIVRSGQQAQRLVVGSN